MKVIIVSDTHTTKRRNHLPTRLVNELEQAELIIHAGDWQTVEVYEHLSKYAPVRGVSGNVDDQGMKELVNEKEIINIKGLSIGIVHGHGEKKTTEKRVLEAFEDEKLDIIIFGHSHIPLLKSVKGTLLFNPGSATDKRQQPYYSFGVMTITEELHLEHVFYKGWP